MGGCEGVLKSLYVRTCVCGSVGKLKRGLSMIYVEGCLRILQEHMYMYVEALKKCVSRNAEETSICACVGGGCT